MWPMVVAVHSILHVSHNSSRNSKKKGEKETRHTRGLKDAVAVFASNDSDAAVSWCQW